MFHYQKKNKINPKNVKAAVLHNMHSYLVTCASYRRAISTLSLLCNCAEVHGDHLIYRFGYERIAAETGRTYRCVQQHIKLLAEHKLLSRHAGKKIYLGDGQWGQEATVITINWTYLLKLKDLFYKRMRSGSSQCLKTQHPQPVRHDFNAPAIPHGNVATEILPPVESYDEFCDSSDQLENENYFEICDEYEKTSADFSVLPEQIAEISAQEKLSTKPVDKRAVDNTVEKLRESCENRHEKMIVHLGTPSLKANNNKKSDGLFNLIKGLPSLYVNARRKYFPQH